MRQVARLLGVVVLAVVLLAVAGYVGFVYTPTPPMPKLSATAETLHLKVGDRDRTFVRYVPNGLAPGAPVVLALHGSMQTGEQYREWLGYGLDVLADRHQFIVLYPDGYGHGWNDCRKTGKTPAKRENVDDLGFIQALLEKTHAEQGADLQRVSAIGYSNGGQLAYRIAIQRPGTLQAILTSGSPWPVADESLCAPDTATPKMILIAGSEDPICPFDGGEVNLFGLSSRGNAVSAMATAELLAKRNGLTDAPTVEPISHQLADDPTSVRRITWQKEGRPFVIYDEVHGGGHVVPQPNRAFPRILGPTTHDIDALSDAIDFFGLTDGGTP